MGGVSEALFSSVFSEEAFVSFLKILFEASACALVASLSLLRHPALRKDRQCFHHHSTPLFQVVNAFPPSKRENLRYVERSFVLQVS